MQRMAVPHSREISSESDKTKHVSTVVKHKEKWYQNLKPNSDCNYTFLVDLSWARQRKSFSCGEGWHASVWHTLQHGVFSNIFFKYKKKYQYPSFQNFENHDIDLKNIFVN